MRQSNLPTKTRKEAPNNEVAKNASLLIRAGFIAKELSGVYSYLPLGLRVLNKINNLIRKEMESLGATEVQMSTLQNMDTWRLSDRHELDVWFKTKLREGGELGLGWTHEEAVTTMMKDHLGSYRDLPRAIYQIQTKFRNEERAKSGLLRGREFLMKDMYSFHTDEKNLDEFYDKVKNSYLKIFETVSLGKSTFLTVASGGAFSEWSHEFQTISETGEDTVYIEDGQVGGVAINDEVYSEEVAQKFGLDPKRLTTKKAIEVGNIFKLGTRFSESIGLKYLTDTSESKPVAMGSYGLGPSRLMGVIAETLSDDKGLVWPASVAPFKVHLILLTKNKDSETVKKANEFYNSLVKNNAEVLYDDREATAGEKLADADLFGMPHRFVISDKSLEAGGVEWKERMSAESKVISFAEALKKINE